MVDKLKKKTFEKKEKKHFFNLSTIKLTIGDKTLENN
jgi:hypothetical protein